MTGILLLAAVKLGLLLFLGLDALVPEPPRGAAGGNVFTASVVGVGKAMAQTAAPQPAPAPAPAPQPATKASGDTLPSLIDVQELAKKKEELDRKEQALTKMEQDLNARLADLQKIEAQLKKAIADAQTAKDEKLKHLIDVYANMKAKQAAQVLETLDETIAVKILAGMKGRQAGEILTNVSAKKAAALSEQLTKLQMPQGELPQMP